jgi:copper(I)-binding protein
MSIDISHPWARSAAADSLEAGGFLTLTNRGSAADRLIAAASPLAGTIELQGIKVVGAGTTMQRLQRGVGLPAGSTITLKPRGYHLLLQGLKSPLAEGQRIPVALTFERAKRRDIELIVAAQGPIGNATLYEG